MPTRASRRRFLASAATSTAAFTILPSGSARTYAANEKLNIAAIGAGGRAASVLRGVDSENIVGLCDVDEQRAAESFATYSRAKRYKDYRVMLDELHGSIDAVIVATPDHHHFHASMAALRLGKHVYCEKPLTHSVWEARQLTAAARDAGVATQMGNQAQASKDTRRVQEFILDNALGPVREVHIWTDRP
jgi:predicted dehydrogenase